MLFSVMRIILQRCHMNDKAFQNTSNFTVVSIASSSIYQCPTSWNIKAPHYWPLHVGNPPVSVVSPHKGPTMRKSVPWHDAILIEIVFPSRVAQTLWQGSLKSQTGLSHCISEKYCSLCMKDWSHQMNHISSTVVLDKHHTTNCSCNPKEIFADMMRKSSAQRVVESFFLKNPTGYTDFHKQLYRYISKTDISNTDDHIFKGPMN